MKTDITSIGFLQLRKLIMYYLYLYYYFKRIETLSHPTFTEYLRKCHRYFVYAKSILFYQNLETFILHQTLTRTALIRCFHVNT